MVQIRSRHYRSLSLGYLEDTHTDDFELVVDTNEAFEPLSALDTTSTLWVWSVATVDNMEGDHHDLVRDQCSKQARGISLPDKRLHFCTWIKEKCQRSPNFND